MKKLAITSQLSIFTRDLQKLEFSSCLSLMQEIKRHIKSLR
jgi:hypothetical protein